MAFCSNGPWPVVATAAAACALSPLIGVENGGAVPQMCSVECIWDRAPHCAFTDLVTYNDRMFCCFRESDEHVYGKNGSIRVLRKDPSWSSVAQLSVEGVDLRDPHFSVTPDNRLMLSVEAAHYVQERCVKRVPYVSFSTDGSVFSPLQAIDSENEWIWRVTWHHGVGYGVSYKVPTDDPRKEWKLTLFTTLDGVTYTSKKVFDILGHPSETTIRFLPDDTMVLLTRRGGNGIVGTAKPPYDSFTWNELSLPLGGPNFLVLPSGTMIASSRVCQNEALETISIGKLSFDSFEPIMNLMPWGYDSSYAGMVYDEKDNLLYISFYWSPSEQGRAAIYIACVDLKFLVVQ